MTDFVRLRTLVSAALELPADQRASWLERHCDDPALREEARALLAHETTDVDELVSGQVAAEVSAVFRPGGITGYELTEALGSGGMGVVWRARQQGALDREVAVKLIRPGFDSRKVVERFAAERRSLARMDHPNIAQVYEAGTTTEGLPWFAMELVEGEPIHRWCDAHQLDVTERLRLFEGVCRGVQHAHQKGIIHRDLKPSNVLVTRRDGLATPKIIDFGIARALDEASEGSPTLTVESQILGTPEYMSPERLAADESSVDTRTDVYSLGVLLYHLLSGSLPYERSSLGPTGPTTDPPRPSTRVTGTAGGAGPAPLRRKIRGDLDWITLKALARRPEDRYATVQNLLDDLAAHRQGRPVSAGPPTLRYRLGKFARRQRVPLAATAIVVALLTAGLLESNRQRLRAESARDEADAVTGFLSDMLASASAEELGRDVTVREVLDRASLGLDDALRHQPLVRARLLTTMGRAYLALGNSDLALERLGEAVRIRESELGPGAEPTLQSRTQRAIALRDDGQLEAAITEFEDVLDRRQRNLDPQDPRLLATLDAVGGAYQQNGDTEAARRAFELAYAGFGKVRGPRDPDTVNAALDLGNLLAEGGQPDRAEPLLESALRISREDLGSDHPQTMSALQSLALLRMDQGNSAECERLLTETLETRRRVYGPGHPGTLEAMINLASVRSLRGDTASAIELLREALPLCRESLGVEHRITLTCMNNLAWALGATGHDDEAEPLLEETVEVRKRVRGEDHLFTLISWNNLGELYLRTGRPRQAEAVHRRVLELRRQSLGEDHPHVMISMTNLASALRDQGRFDEAARLYEQSWQKQREILGADHPDAIRTAQEALRLCEMARRPAEAERWTGRTTPPQPAGRD